MKVYLVKLDWSTDSGNDVELTVYDAYEKAYTKFKELIADEMDPENSWVGDLEWKDDVPQDDRIERRKHQLASSFLYRQKQRRNYARSHAGA